jgi:hypothetical protein
LSIRELTTYSVEVELRGRGILRVHHRLKTHHVALVFCVAVLRSVNSRGGEGGVLVTRVVARCPNGEGAFRM